VPSLSYHVTLTVSMDSYLGGVTDCCFVNLFCPDKTGNNRVKCVRIIYFASNYASYVQRSQEGDGRGM
jgi:hypothetical protein